MLPLLNAIYSAFTSDGALFLALAGGLHREQAPEGTAMPYAVSHVVESKLLYSFGGPYRSQTRVRFSVYGVGHDATAGAIGALVTSFDDRLFTLSSGTHVSTIRLDDPTPKLHKHDADGNDVWEWAVTYEYSVRL